MKKKIRIFFTIWIIFWIYFIIRDLFIHRQFNDYKILISRNVTGKKSYTYGDYLFEFLEFCENALPENSYYNFIGIEKGSIENRRAVYHLYPHIEREKPDFLLVFDKPGYSKKGYMLYKTLDNKRFILKRIWQ